MSKFDESKEGARLMMEIKSIESKMSKKDKVVLGIYFAISTASLIYMLFSGCELQRIGLLMWRCAP